jgi:hypothetical protein
VGRDGFILRETVCEYYQVARLTPAELKTRGVNAPAEYLASLTASGAGALPDADDDREPRADDGGGEQAMTPLYGGGVLIFDEYGKLKHWVHKDVFSERQTKRLEYLWNEGFLYVDRGSARYRPARFSTMHLRRATDVHQRPSERW